jgi:hypothetical protein
MSASEKAARQANHVPGRARCTRRLARSRRRLHLRAEPPNPGPRPPRR